MLDAWIPFASYILEAGTNPDEVLAIWPIYLHDIATLSEISYTSTALGIVLTTTHIQSLFGVCPNGTVVLGT